MKIGILGSGQLGRMLALAGIPLGFSFRFYDEKPGAPTTELGESFIGSYTDTEQLKKFADGCTFVTYEFENIPLETVQFISQLVSLSPSKLALETSQDRIREKTFFSSLGIKVPRFEWASTLIELEAAITKVKVPCIIKTTTLGYDGKGQVRCVSIEQISQIWKQLGGVPLIVEEQISFDRELSIIGVRNTQGEILTYSLIQNEHKGGILRQSTFPAPAISSEIQDSAVSIINTTISALDYVGVLAIELFQCGEELLVNEMAPRVHNSGHITVDCCVTGQFENHIRAITGLPLGDVRIRERGVMLNVLSQAPVTTGIAKLKNAKVHLYGKSDAVGRKIGHINLLSPSEDDITDVKTLLT